MYYALIIVYQSGRQEKNECGHEGEVIFRIAIFSLFTGRSVSLRPTVSEAFASELIA